MCEVSIAIEKITPNGQLTTTDLFILPCLCIRKSEVAYLSGSGSASPMKLRGNMSAWAAVTEGLAGVEDPLPTWLLHQELRARSLLAACRRPLSFHIHPFPGLL